MRLNGGFSLATEYACFPRFGKMPRYHFNVRHHDLNRDEEGVELDDAGAAGREAVQACSEMIRDIDGALSFGPEWCMEVTDAASERLFAIKLSAEAFRPDEGTTGSDTG